MNSQVAVLVDAVELLENTLKEWSSKEGGSVKTDIRRSFINRHAWNIHDLAKDVIVLAQAERLGAIYMLSRPALESLFKLSASMNDEAFARHKVVAEVVEERKKIGNWRAAANDAWKITLDESIKMLSEYEADLRKRYVVTGNREWKIFEVAKIGKLEAKYVRDYFTGSTHVHAMLSALIAREDELYVPVAIHQLTNCVIEASGLVAVALDKLEGWIMPGVFEKLIGLLNSAESECHLVSEAQTADLKAKGFQGVAPMGMEGV